MLNAPQMHPQQQQHQIIDLVITIFQNVGIKRIIDKIDILKNYQIYFQICKVIFPQTMIQLLRFSEGKLNNSQKIQGVIDIVGKILQNDLYHISGQAISQGKLSHIRNFLHILELLSQNVHKGNGNQEEVESAPQNTRSMSDYDEQGHYTVIGIDKQFQREYQDQEGQNQDYNDEQQDQTKRQYKSHKGNNQRPYKSHIQSQSSQSQGPMNPILDKKGGNIQKKGKRQKRKQIKRQPQEIRIVHQVRPKPIPQFTFAPQKRKPLVPLQKVVLKAQPEQNIKKKIKSSFLKKTNYIIQDLQRQNLISLNKEHQTWVQNHNKREYQKQNQIQNQNKQRIQFTNQLIQQRASNINSLKTQKWAMKVMKNLFQQQKQIRKGMKKAKQQSQLEQIQSMIKNYWKDQSLLRQAFNASKAINYLPKSKY